MFYPDPELTIRQQYERAYRNARCMRSLGFDAARARNQTPPIQPVNVYMVKIASGHRLNCIHYGVDTYHWHDYQRGLKFWRYAK